MENTHILTNNLNGAHTEVHATTNNTASSYGQPVWEDSNGQAYCQVGLEAPFYTVTPIAPTAPNPTNQKTTNQKNQ